MEIEPIGIQGVFLVKPTVFPDNRGEFLEMFSGPAFERAVGHPLTVAQVNCSASVRGTVRGLHGIALPGQARYMTCPAGAMVDIVVDTRVGSPTYRQHVAVELSAANRHALYLAEGLVHGFAPLSESATVVYLCSSTWSPGAAYQITPLDPELDLPWPTDVPPVLSEKDLAAPSLRQAEELGVLPTWEQCQARYAELADLTAVAN